MDILSILAEVAAASIVPLIAAIITAVKAFRFIYEGELGIRLRWGRAVIDKATGKPKVIHPGFVLMIPWVDILQRRHVRQQIVRLDNQQFLLKDGMIMDVNGYVLFRVNDVYKALFEVANLDDAITEFAMGVVRAEMAKRSFDGIADVAEISRHVMEQLRPRATDWGVELIAFELTNLSPSREVAAIASIPVRARMLQTAADAIGYKDISTLPAQLASVLIGAPLIASMHHNVENHISESDQ